MLEYNNIPDYLANFRLPLITAQEFMSRRKPKNGKKPNRTPRAPNSYIIYRTVFGQEIRKVCRLQQMEISRFSSDLWHRELPHVKQHYNDLAMEIEALLQEENRSNLPPIERQTPIQSVDGFMRRFDDLYPISDPSLKMQNFDCGMFEFDPYYDLNGHDYILQTLHGISGSSSAPEFQYYQPNYFHKLPVNDDDADPDYQQGEEELTYYQQGQGEEDPADYQQGEEKERNAFL